MDLVLLVIAADEGIMPQTREHIDILSELGIRKGIIVLNKCDLVDAEWLEFAEQEIREELDEMDASFFPHCVSNLFPVSGISFPIEYIMTHG